MSNDMSRSRELELQKLLRSAISACDRACSEAETAGIDWLRVDALVARGNFQAILEQSVSGSLLPSQGAGLGITRALSEWAPTFLYDAGALVEDFYRKNF